MLLSFRIANFRSIRNEQVFSFVRDSYAGPPAATSADAKRPWDARVGTVAGLYGANASGKSNVLKGLTFMRGAVLNSFQNWSSGAPIPVDPFRLGAVSGREPSLFEVTFVINRVRYQYGFRITVSEVVGEWLYAYPTSRRQIWFERDISADEPYYFGKSFPGRNRVIADLTRPNSLFLSAAAANNHKQVDIVNHWFRAHLRMASPEDRSARIDYTANMSSSENRWKQVTELIQFADLGICKARVREEQVDEAQRARLRGLLRALGPADANLDDKQLDKAVEQASRVVEFGHSTDGSPEPIYLPFESESLGTQTWFALVGPVIRAINNADTLLVDELDASLHPHLTSEILKIFREPSKNPKQGQIIFTTHDTTLLGTLLGERELFRDQVWFTEKQPDGATSVYPLTDFAPRKYENLERGYLQGRYGAVPFLDERILGEIAGQVNPSERHDEATEDGLSSALEGADR
jgi:energy-coupling factor transporter ATP-binding protein EcfA2